MFQMRYSWKTFLIPAITTVLGGVLALFLRGLPVEVAVDVAVPGDGDIRAVWDDEQVVLDEIDAGYAPHHYAVEVRSDEPASRGDAGGFQLVAMASVDGVEMAPESAWSTVSTYFLLHGPERPARLTLSGLNLGPSPYLSFETDLASDTVVIKQPDRAPETLDLRSEERGKRVFPIRPPERLHRFHGQVPRRALGDLAILVPAGDASDVRRVYVNAWLPRVYYTGSAPEGRRPVAIVEEAWKPTWDGNRLLLPAAFYLGAGMFSSLLAGCLGGLAAGASILGGVAVLRFFRRRPASDGDRNWLAYPLHWKWGLLLWGGTFLVWFVFLVAFYPGTMNADSLSQWAQAQDYAFEPQHPPFYAWLMWLLSGLWDSPFSTALPQVILGSALVAYATALLWSAGVHRAIVIGVYLLGTFSPRNMTMMIALIKDAPYGICLFAAGLLLARILLRRNRPNWGTWIALGIVLGASTLFRHNGPLVVAAVLPCLFLLLFRQWRGVAVCMACILVVFIGARAAVLSRLPMEPSDGGLHDMMTAHLAILVDRDVPLRNEDYAYLANVRDLEDRWAYDERRVAATTMPFLEEAYHRAWARDHAGAYRARYIDLVRRNPLTASRYFWDRGSFLVLPWYTGTPMETYFLGISRNDLGLSSFEIFLTLPGQLRSLVAWTAGDGLRWLFWRPALPLYLILVACAVLCWRMRDPAWAMVYLPFVINTGVIAVAAISQACRYQYPLTFAAAFLIGLAFLPRDSENARRASDRNV